MPLTNRIAALVWVCALGAGCGPGEVESEGCAAGEVDDGGVCVAERCGAGEWGDLPDLAAEADGDVVWVAPHGDRDAAGSRDDPFDRIEDAVEAVGEGGLVLVSAGEFDRTIEVSSDATGTTVVGRCPELTVIDGSDEGVPTLSYEPGQYGLRGVTVTGGRIGIEAVSEGFLAQLVDLDLRDVVIADIEGRGLVAIGNVEVSMQDCVVRDISASEEDWSSGRGLDVEAGAVVVASGLTVDGTVGTGIVSVLPGSHVELVGSVVRGNRQALRDDFATEALAVIMGGSAHVEDTLFVDNAARGITVDGEGSSAELVDVRVEDTLLWVGEPTGSGAELEWSIGAAFGATLTARGLLIDGGFRRALDIWGAGADANLTDVTIRGIAAGSKDLTHQYTVLVSAAARLKATRLVLEDSAHVGLACIEPGSELELVDSTLVGGVTETDEGTAIGLLVGLDCVVEATGLDVGDVTGIAVLAQQGARLTLRDVDVHDVRRWESNTGGAVVARSGASVEVDGATVERVVGVGLFSAGEGSTILVENAVVRISRDDPGAGVSTSLGAQDLGSLVARSVEVSGDLGIGVSMVTGGVVELEDSVVTNTGLGVGRGLGPCVGVWGAGSTFVGRSVELVGCEDYGIFADVQGAVVSLDGVTIRDTSPLFLGVGVAVTGATFTATDLLVENVWAVGVLVLGVGAEADIQDSVIRGVRSGVYSGDGIGVATQWWAEATVRDTVIEDNEGVGLYGFATSFAECIDCDIHGNAFAGVAVTSEAHVSLVGGAVYDNLPSPAHGGGVGIFGWDVEGPPTLDVDGVSVRGHPGPGLYLRGQGFFSVTDSTFEDNGTAQNSPAGSVAALGVQDLLFSAELHLEGNLLGGIGHPPVLLHHSDARLVDNEFDRDGAWDLRRQDCEGVDPPEVVGAPVADSGCELASVEVDPLLDYFVLVVEESTAP